MNPPPTGKWLEKSEAALRYGLAFASIGAALGVADIFLYFHVPQPFTAFALSAIAISFWYGGNKPGILAAVLASFVRYYHWPEANAAPRAIYDLVFLVFALLMMGVNRARGELEVRVAERTADLSRANEYLKLEIAERERTEEKLRESEAYLAEAQKLTRTGSWVWEVAGKRALHLSDEWYRVYDFDPQDGMPGFDTRLQRIHPDDRSHWKGVIDRAISEKSEYQTDFRILLPSGTIRHLHTLGHPVLDGSGDLVQFVGSTTDITERKLAEEALRRSEANLAQAQKLTHTGSWAWDVTAPRALHLSEEWYRIYGFDSNEGLPAWKKRLERIHPDDRARREQQINRAISEKSEYEIEYRIIFPDGTIRHLHSVGHPLLNSRGDLVQFVGSSTDVTERRQAEQALRQAQADLARISRITTMGELTASLAHEVNQPIAAAMTDANTCLRWLNRDHPDLEEAREAATRVVKDATRAAEIISRTRLLFKRANPKSELTDINDVIRDTLALMIGDISRNSISVRIQLEDDLPKITGDRVQLQQVIMNLIVNGIDAMKDADGTRELAINSQRAESQQLIVSISDTGVGLPVGQAEQIFNAFFTTKPNGTGMGLRISRSIIESHSGRLWAVDNSPRGAIFHLALPIYAAGQE